MMLIGILPVALAFGRAHAWGFVGHEIVTTIAQIHLHPTVIPKLCTIFNYTSTDPSTPQCHLAPFATWADRVRFNYRWSAAMHYVGAVEDHPSDVCAFPGGKGWEGKENINVLSAIRNTTNILRDWEGGYDNLSNEALKFLIHFVGDMHQPLHLTGRDRGGNGAKVDFDGRHTNLHSVWDNSLIAQRIRTIPRNYSSPLPVPAIEHNLRHTIYDNLIRRIMWEGILGKWKNELDQWVSCPISAQQPETIGIWQKFLNVFKAPGDGGLGTDDDILCPYHWAQAIHPLNCEIIWPKELDETKYRSVSHFNDIDREHQCEEDETEFFAELHREHLHGFHSLPPRIPSPFLELDTPQYAGKIANEWILEKLLAQGGIRLAAVLNWLFADLEDGEVMQRGIFN